MSVTATILLCYETFEFVATIQLCHLPPPLINYPFPTYHFFPPEPTPGDEIFYEINFF